MAVTKSQINFDQMKFQMSRATYELILISRSR